MNLEDLLRDPAALALATAAYGRPAALQPTIVTVKANVDASALITPRAPKTGTRVAKGSPAPRLGDKPISATCALPSKGTLGAADFLALLRVAGKRQASDETTVVDDVTGEVKSVSVPRVSESGTPIMIHDTIAQRLDERAAVSAFVGWDLSQPHGTQLDSAVRLAQGIMRKMARLAAGEQAEQYTHRDPAAHSAKWSVAGFVKGLPAPVTKMLADLVARERLAVNDEVTFANLRKFVQEGDRCGFDRLVTKEFPTTQGVKPILNEEGKEVGYEHVEVPNPIGAKIAATRTDLPQLMVLLASLEMLAHARLEAIRNDIAGLDSEAPTAAQIEAAHRAMLGRGASTIEEGIALLDTTPRA